MKTASPRDASTSRPAASERVLVDPEWLEAHLSDPRVRVIEVDVSKAAYDDWHIDGAVLWNVYADLKDADYHLVDATALERLAAGSGIGPDSTVVFYGYAPALGFWLMKLYGQADVRILDCSRDAWRAAGYQCSTTVSEPPSGGMEPGGRAGHLPGAVHQPVDGLYREDGSFRSAAELRTVFAPDVLDGSAELITYCTIGGRAATAWFVLSQLIGRDRVRVYDGSWAEWGRLPDVPVETS